MGLSMTSDSSRSKFLRIRKPNIVLSDEQWLSVIEALENEDIIKAKRFYIKQKELVIKKRFQEYQKYFIK